MTAFALTGLVWLGIISCYLVRVAYLRHKASLDKARARRIAQKDQNTRNGFAGLRRLTAPNRGHHEPEDAA